MLTKKSSASNCENGHPVSSYWVDTFDNYWILSSLQLGSVGCQWSWLVALNVVQVLVDRTTPQLEGLAVQWTWKTRVLNWDVRETRKGGLGPDAPFVFNVKWIWTEMPCAIFEDVFQGPGVWIPCSPFCVHASMLQATTTICSVQVPCRYCDCSPVFEVPLTLDLPQCMYNVTFFRYYSIFKNTRNRPGFNFGS
jgi:hypothetical protein